MRRALLALLLCACGSAPQTSAVTAPLAAPELTCPRATSVEAAAVEAEVTCLLQRYVRIDTTNPPGNEIAGVRFLAEVLRREGIESEIVESTPGRASLVARRRGSGTGKAIVLLHHVDVVPATADEWSEPPFSGALHDGFVWGRGAIDNKGGGIVELVAFVMLHRLGVTLDRDVVLLAVADEEAGGGWGARWLLEHRPELFAGVGYVLNEGGAILDLGGKVAYGVEVAQKAPLWLRVTAEGRSGHASMPHDAAATHVLARALGRLAAHRFPITVLPEVQAMFAARAAAAPPEQREKLADLRKSLEDAAFRETFLANPHDAALVRNTLSITMLEGSDKENVLPPRASAVLDVRLLPGERADAVTAAVMAAMAEPALKVETLLSWEAQAAPKDTPLFHAIEALARERDSGAPVNAHVIGGFTDCSAFRARGIVCYGFLPLRLDLDTLGRVHGKDERVAVASLARGVGDLLILLDNIEGG